MAGRKLLLVLNLSSTSNDLFFFLKKKSKIDSNGLATDKCRKCKTIE